MKKILQLGLLTVIAICQLAAGAFAQTSIENQVILVGDESWEPFYGPDLPGDGFVMEIVRQSYKQAGFSTKIIYRPWSRALAMVAEGRAHAAVGAYYTAERATRFHYSAPFYTSAVILIALKSHPVTFGGDLTQLSPYYIGVIWENAYSEAFDNASFLQKEAVSNPLHNLKKLFAGRIDLMADTQARILHLMSKHEEFRREDIQILSPPLAEHELHLIFDKKLKTEETSLQAFNQGLQKIRESGAYQEILSHYGVR